MSIYKLFFDGCSKGNPGKAGAGAVLYLHNLEILEIWAESKYVGDHITNNVAEYTGLIIGLERLNHDQDSKLFVNVESSTLTIIGDSLLVIKQMQGKYVVKSPALIPLYEKAKALVASLKVGNIMYAHVLRDENKRADLLSNLGLVKSD